MTETRTRAPGLPGLFGDMGEALTALGWTERWQDGRWQLPGEDPLPIVEAAEEAGLDTLTPYRVKATGPLTFETQVWAVDEADAQEEASARLHGLLPPELALADPATFTWTAEPQTQAPADEPTRLSRLQALAARLKREQVRFVAAQLGHSTFTVRYVLHEDYRYPVLDGVFPGREAGAGDEAEAESGRLVRRLRDGDGGDVLDTLLMLDYDPDVGEEGDTLTYAAQEEPDA